MYQTFKDQGRIYFVHSIVSLEYFPDASADEDRIDSGDAASVVDESSLSLSLADGTILELVGAAATELHQALQKASTAIVQSE